MKLSDDVSRYHRPAQYESKRKRNCNTVDIICKKKYYMHNYLELSCIYKQCPIEISGIEISN